MSDARSEGRGANAALRLWRADGGSLRRVGDSANRVFSFIESGETRYLRLAPAGSRTKEQVEAELDFVAYLHRGGVSVARPIASAAGRLVEEIAVAGGDLLACVFEEAKGERFKYDPARPDAEHFRLRGRTLGRIHALSKSYIPPAGRRRFAWNEDRLLLEAAQVLPASEEAVWREYAALRERLLRYPRAEGRYGLIHGDFGESNYRHTGAQLNVFDFDDCCYHWLVYDLAVTIYPHGWRPEGARLLDRLLEGYAESMTLDVSRGDVTMFCQWRLIYMFLTYARKWGFKNLTAQQAAWFARKRENIARGYEWYG